MKIFDKLILELKYPKNEVISNYCYLANISGIDSIATIAETLNNNPSSTVIPSIIELSVEYGDRILYSNVIKKLKEKYGKRILPSIISDSNDLWKAIASSNIPEIINLFGFYTPCIACHLVLHLIRIKIAQHLSIINVISGEREIHSDREKINQLDFVLDFYNNLYKNVGIKLHLPLRYVSDNLIIKEIISKNNLIFVELKSLYSDSYYKSGTSEIAISKSKISDYLNRFLFPLISNFNDSVIINCRVECY